MNRLDEIRCYMENYIKDKADESIAAEIEYLNTALNEVKGKLIFRIRQAFENSTMETDKIVICYLHSAIAEGKCELCLIPFKDNPFIIMPENEVYMEYSEILKLVVVENSYWEKIMRKKFIQLLSYEIEEIRREYLYRYSAGIGEILNRIFDGDDGNIRVFFGAYMGEIKEIGRILI